MASMAKLSIRGVRAFSPDDQEQVIEFMSPVTCIVGANGCGKTTIIESLKYAVTGTLPPGKNSGQAFVHDPRSIGHSSVKANIKLRFNNKAGHSMVVVRAMEVTQKKTTMSFKALDGVLRTYDEDGKKTSTSQRCSELDRQIPILLGVSKAVLENVVFCHQEDASWPLAESSVLKKRFDDIFDSTRYAKALETIRKSKKEYSDKAKDLKGDVQGLMAHKHAAVAFRKDQAEYTDRLEEVEDDIKQCNVEIKEAQAEIERARKIADQVEALKNDIDEEEARLDKEQSVLATQRQMLERDLTKDNTLRELKTMLRDFDSSRQQQLEEKDTLEGDCENLRTDMEKIRKEEMSFRSQIGKFEAENESHNELLKRRLNKMEAVANKYNMDLSVSQSQAMTWIGTQGTVGTEVDGSQESAATVQIIQEDMDAFHRGLDVKENELKKNLSQQRRQSQQQEDDLQNELNSLIASKNALENDKERNFKQRDVLREELNELGAQVVAQRATVKKWDVDQAKTQAEKFAKDLENATREAELQDIPTKIRSVQIKQDALKREIDDDQECVRGLRESSTAQNEIKILQETVDRELDALYDFVNGQSSTFQRFNIDVSNPLPGKDGDAEGTELVAAIRTVSEKSHEKVEATNQEWGKAKEEVENKQQIVSEKSAVLAHNRSTLASLRERLDVLANVGGIEKFDQTVNLLKSFEVGAGVVANIDSKDPQKVLAYLSSRIEEIESSMAESVPPQMLANIIDQLVDLANYRNPSTGEVMDQRCPCCRRKIEDVKSARNFKKSMEELKGPGSALLEKNREKTEKDSSAKLNYQRWRTDVSESMGDVLQFMRMESEANAIETAIASDEKDLSLAEKELAGLTSDSRELQKEANELRALAESSTRWIEEASRIAETKSRIRMQQDFSLTYSVGNIHAGMDLETVEAELQRKQAEKERLADEITKYNKITMDLNGKISRCTQQVRRAEENAKDKEQRFGQEQRAHKRKDEISKEIGQLQKEEVKIREKMGPMQQKIKNKEDSKAAMREQAKSEEEKLSLSLNEFTGHVKELLDLSSAIDKYNTSNKPGELDRLGEDVAAISGRMDEKQARLSSLMPELERLTKLIEDQEREKKNILANIDLITAGQRLQEVKKRFEALNGDLSEVEGKETYEAVYTEATKRRQELVSNVDRQEGLRTGLIEQIRKAKRMLKTPEYDNIDDRHRISKIKLDTTELAVKDIQKYYEALDKALLRYHSIKIAEINKLIRELWELTYKGMDISNIEIVSGQDGGASAAAKSKRSYDYRVVMTKGGQKLDMRGRCSAGQRVLASIVIRLALAETFCVQCGCMALDEPTVNLDWRNKKGLAIALAQIIASRAQQSNFQLIVITHDEDFVALMKTELSTQATGFSMPEKYFQVRREEGADNKFYSKIEAVDWDELM